MTTPSPSNARDAAPDDVRQLMSDLADGRADAAAASGAWREDASAREAWHAYHLIGDVLRSEDLAMAPAGDADFLHRFRSRLDAEPPLLAPAPGGPGEAGAAAGHHRLGWRAPAAVAAGVAAVAAVVVLTRPAWGPQAVAPTLASASSNEAASGAPGSLPVTVTDGRMIRDARLDAYLRAHAVMRGGAPLALPGGDVRSVEMLLSPTAALPASAQPGAGR